MQLPTHPILRAVAWLSVSFLAAGCSSSDSRAQAALGAYQAAAASNDLFGARRALLQLVKAKDDVSDYWVELGKLEAAMGSYGDAYYAFTRAYELDRSNPDLIRALVQLSLRSGDIGSAESHARELEVLAPGDPWVKMVKGWSAFSDSHYDQSLAISDELLAQSPGDPTATILKARSLIDLNREPEALDLLTKQVQSQPSDFGSLALLARIYEHQEDWAKVAQTAQRLVAINSSDQQDMLLLVKASFRAGDVAGARQASLKILRPNADPQMVSSVLNLWTDYWPSAQRVSDARRLAAAASGVQRRLIYADFLNRVGSPADGIRLAGAIATLPVNAQNAEANAVYADALWRIGNSAAAKQRFDAVLAFDPGNSTALRGRSELEIRTGNPKAAIFDAQKLTTVLPNSSSDRLLLARAYSAAGQNDWADRTLWSAFQDIPADERIYAALRASRIGNADGLSEIQEEFDRQRDAKLNRGLL
jgi:predicted Zn-dependent protease